jgi:hypothetical protein
MLLTCTVLQVVYPATSCRALPDSFSPSDQEAHAGAMRQATAVLQWADKFGAAELMQRAEDFLCKRVRLMITVRPLHAGDTYRQCTGTHQVTTQAPDRCRRSADTLIAQTMT